MTNSADTLTGNALQQKWDELKASEPRLRIRDAAARLGVGEAQLVALGVGRNAVKLRNDVENIFNKLPELGYVMALTRNESAVHEKKGHYKNISINHGMATVLGEEIDLRAFFRSWASVFAVEVENAHGTMQSLQFFDAQGNAVHKVFLQESSDRQAYDSLISAFRSEDQSPEIDLAPAAPKREHKKAEEVDGEQFRADWANLKDTHEFHILLSKHNISRTDAVRLAGEFAYRVGNDSLRKLLLDCSSVGNDIMIFVGNQGMIQIHTGTVKNIKEMNEWINVMDPDFNLHLREDLIAETWVVKKPTTDGIVTSLELFDKEGDIIATLFGKRKPGMPELENWRAALDKLGKV